MNFWSQFNQAKCFPDKCQCEAARDALIRQPSAFWSSLAYVLAGLAIFQYFKSKSLELKLWASVCIIMGLSSMFGHASYIQFALSLDFASIILVLSFFAVLNLLRLLKLSAPKILLIFLGYYVLLFFAMDMMEKWTKISICFLVFLFAVGDVIRDEGWDFLTQKDLQISLVTLMISFGLFLMDEFHVGCDPMSLFQWHSLWHLGSGAAMYFYGKWRLSSV